jgi:hypothetical protein
VLGGCSDSGSPELLLAQRGAPLTLGQARWQQPSVTLPPARMAHALIYDPARGATLAVGGRPVDDAGDSRSDTWAWDGSAWTELAAGFPQRGFIEGAFDAARQVSVVYGGIDRTPGSAYFAETEELGTGTWSNRSTTPGTRSSGGLAFDSARGVTVLFGGFDGTAWLDDLWEWDGSTWTPGCASAPCSTSPRPSRRAGMVLTYDAARRQTVLFGGFESSGSDNYLGDTWTWDGSAWTEQTTPSAPSARVSAAANYDPVTRLVYLFGGAAGPSELSDLWAWEGSVWQRIEVDGLPGARRDARLAWDTQRRRGVLFGGRADAEAVDFWELSLVGNECALADECHTGFCEDARCVDTPSPPTPAPDAGAGGTGASGTGGAGNAGGSSGAGAPDAGVDAGGGGPAASGAAGDSAVRDPPPPAARASRDKSLYACSTSARSDRHAARGGWLASLAVLLAHRRRQRSRVL